MKNLDLNKYGIQEMNAGEMRENNGGFIPAAMLAIWAIEVTIDMGLIAIYAAQKQR